MEMAKIREYKPEGMIRQLPALRKDYKKKNEAGGRYSPVGYIGAAIKRSNDAPWERGIKSVHDLSIRLVPSEDQLELELNLYDPDADRFGRQNGEVK
jgi:hypothetical protein